MYGFVSLDFGFLKYLTSVMLFPTLPSVQSYMSREMSQAKVPEGGGVTGAFQHVYVS